MIENKILRKKISAKIASRELLFPPLVKAKNQHQKFKRHLKEKRCLIGRLNVPNFCLKKFRLTLFHVASEPTYFTLGGGKFLPPPLTSSFLKIET